MLSAAIQAEILRLHYAERWGYSQIARHLGIHRESARKVALRRSVALAPAPPAPRTTVVRGAGGAGVRATLRRRATLRALSRWLPRWRAIWL